MPDPYPTPAGVEAAIKDAARKAAKADAALDVNRRIQLEYFDRFLSRIFADDETSAWLLKGGAGMLARVPSSRATLDVDLAARGFTLNQALDELIRLAIVDLGDHFRFEYASHEESIGTDNQPYTDGYEVKFTIYIGAASRGPLKVDLTVGAGVTGQVTTAEPANALRLPRLVSHAYRLYPAVDQIADKVCAIMADYGERASSREKDLVDLVVFAVTQDIHGGSLRTAIATETRRRKMESFDHFIVPTTWGAGYAKLAKPIPHCADYVTVELATALVTRFIDPALDGSSNGKAWQHGQLSWL